MCSVINGLRSPNRFDVLNDEFTDPSEEIQALYDAINSNSNQITKNEIDSMLGYNVKVIRPFILNKEECNLARSLLLTPEGNFVIDNLLGKGGMKQVYCVVDIDTKKKYVVGVCKRTLVSERAWEAFKREIAFMLSMKGQEGVAQIKDYHFFENGDLNQHEGYVVMEYYDLVDLFKVIVNKTIPLTIENKLQIALDCATGLKNIHDQNISHRDIKWENVFIYSDNGQVRARIGDLGLACSNSDTQELKKLAGSRMFFPPERAVLVRKKNSFFTTRYSLMMGDVWALGEVFYSLFLPNDQCLSFQGGHERFVHDRICDTTQESLTQEIDEAKIELPEMRELIKKMTRIGLYERPNSSEVVEAIVRISAIYSRRAI